MRKSSRRGKREAEIYRPESVRELLTIYNSNPGAVLFAGGTSLMAGEIYGMESEDYRNQRGASVESIVSLERVSELNRIVRKERYLEIGAAVPLSKILAIGSRVIPRALFSSLSVVGPPSVRNLATLGGGLCAANVAFSPLPVLDVLGARLELRSKAKTRWLSISDFLVEEGVTQLSVNEILTRIRIPYSDWDIQYFRRVGEWGNPDYPVLNFCALVRTEKDTIEDVKFALGGLPEGIIRDRKLELSITGLKIPIGERDKKVILKRWEELLNEGIGRNVSKETGELGRNLNYQIKTGIKIFKSFVEGLVFLNYSGFNI